MKILVGIGGPTGAGKTKLAIELAGRLGTEIVSYDSRQIYKELRIGVARPTPSELAQIPHHFIGTHSIRTHYTVADFEKESIARLEQLFVNSNYVIAAGGTGLYLDALTFGLDEMPAISEEVDEEIEKCLKENGLEWLQNYVAQKDPDYFKAVDIANPMRLLRAAKVIASSGRTFSSFRTRTSKARSFEFLKFAILPDREQLYHRINDRVEEMVMEGLVEEARSLHGLKGLKALDTVGYRELFAHFDGHISLTEAIEKIKQNTRRYAKRQITWFNNHPGWTKLPGDDFASYSSFIMDKIHDLESKT